MSVVKTLFLKEMANQSGPPLRVFHDNPVQIGHVEKSVGQAGQLSFLHWAAVSRSDDVESRKALGPRRRPAVNVLSADHMHNVTALQ